MANATFQDIKEQLAQSNETQTVTKDEVVAIRQTFDDMVSLQKDSRLDQLEKEREGNKVAAAAAAGPDTAGGSVAKAGMGLGKFGLAAGAIAGLAAVAASFLEIDTKKIKASVKDLLSISDDLGGAGAFIGDSATFLLAMSGIGAGLAVFGVGSAIAGIGSAIANFSDPAWAQTLKDNVITLLSIDDALGSAGAFIGDSATFFLAMTGIAGGLAVFGVGSAIAGIGGAVANFSDPAWAEGIKNGVITLMSISDELGGSAAFIGGSATFLLAMGGIAAGLMAFAAAEGFAGIVKFFTGDSVIDKIVNNVKQLMGIRETLGDDPVGMTEKFKISLGNMGDALSSFAGGQFVGKLKGLGSAILGFFGAESPFDQIMEISKNADELDKGGKAIGTIAEALEKFGNIKVSDVDVDFEGLAKDLGQALPLMKGLANGGKVKRGLFSFDVDFGKGILDPDLKLDEMAAAIAKMNFVLGRSTEYPSLNGVGNTQGTLINDQMNEYNNVKASTIPLQNSSIINADNSVTTNQTNPLTIQVPGPGDWIDDMLTPHGVPR